MGKRNKDIDDVENQLLEAAKLMQCFPLVASGGRALAVMRQIQDFWVSQGLELTELGMAQPDTDAIDQLEEVWGWLEKLSADDLRLVWLRSQGLQWKEIMRVCQIGRTQAYQQWLLILTRLAANRQE